MNLSSSRSTFTYFLTFGSLADQVPPCHDHLHITKSLEVVERILVGNDQIGALAGLDSAGDRIDMRNLGVSFRCGVESKPIRHAAILVEIDKLSPHIVVCDERAAGVGSEPDGNPVCKALLGAVDDALKDDRAVVLLDLSRVGDGTVKQRVGQGRRDRCAEKRGARLEQADHLVIRLCAVLDGVNAVFKRDAHALGALDVGGDHKPALVRLVASCLDIFGRHFQHARLALDFCVQHAAGYHELDQIRLIFCDLRDEISRLFRALGDISERASHVPVRDGDRHISREYSRTDRLPGVYIVADARIGIFNAADRSDGCNAAVELHLRRAAADSREEMSREMARLAERKAAAESEYDATAAKLWDEYQLTVSQAEELCVEFDSLPALRAQVADLRNQIRALGNVNVSAIEEYQEVRERYDALSAQVADVEGSRNELTRMIASLSGQMKEIFTDSFRAINENFGRIFAELFGGGEASLVLEDESDVLSCGIGIQVAPPGKVIKNLEALSGGEQALVAISIYFAILAVNPAPFCILDEIEAALDDANVSRFAQYLRRVSDKTQFIVITHRRGTMEAANVLYGVTMQEDGVSKLLKLDLEQVDATLVS